jgi:AraC-like DNA-binding protein
LRQTLDLLFDEAATQQSGQQLVLDRLCDVLLVQVIRHAFATDQLDQGTLSGFSDPGLSRALVAIHNDLAYAWNLEKLASISGMSRSKFAKHFHEVVGRTPAEYLADQRMTLAQKLLKKHKPVQTVALEVGYGSQPAFTKAFTAKLGMSPRAWLNRLHSSRLRSAAA